jgi:hypothetical protein
MVAECPVAGSKMQAEEKHTIDAMGRNSIQIYRLDQTKLDREFYSPENFLQTISPWVNTIGQIIFCSSI